MRPLFSHLNQSACLWGQFIFHRWNFDSLIKGCFSDKIFLIDLRDGLSPHHWLDLRFLPSFFTIKIEIFPLLFMIKVSLLLLFKGLSFLINLSLCKYTWLDVYLSDWFKININSIITLSLLIFFLYFLLFGLI